MFEYKIITAIRPEFLAEQINDLVSQKFTLDNVIPTATETGIHFTAVLKKTTYHGPYSNFKEVEGALNDHN